jgi:adenylate cyclase
MFGLGRREVAIKANWRALILYNVACVYSHAGEADTSLDYLEKSGANGMVHMEWIEHDTDLDPLRNHPRFRALLKID